MSSSSLPSLDNVVIPPLDPGLLALDQDELEFFKTLTGIRDEDALKKHIIDVQTKAYSVFPYPCIRLFNFTKLKIARLPAYDDTIRLRNTRPDAILLDVGCCFGNDLRKAVLDGWPAENTIGVDIEPNFWKHGYELFKSSSDSFPAAFIAGDIFSPELIPPSEPFYDHPSSPRPENIRSLQSLSPLQGHVSVIHASSLFHLFDEEKQANVAKQLASLLSPEPGSIIFGTHAGLAEKGIIPIPKFPMFCHGPESWKDLWDGQAFQKGTVHVKVQLDYVEKPGWKEKEDSKYYMMAWSVTRV